MLRKWEDTRGMTARLLLRETCEPDLRDDFSNTCLLVTTPTFPLGSDAALIASFVGAKTVIRPPAADQRGF